MTSPAVEAVLPAAIGLLPVLVFLVLLMLIDSYKLVRLHAVVRSLAAGVLAAIACFLLHKGLLSILQLELSTFAKYVAPLTEESMKALYVVYLIRVHRVGFPVDAAIHGFAVGAGFAFAENVYYLHALEGANLWTWIVRGFGTAIMHGGTMALMGITTKNIFDRGSLRAYYLPGLAIGWGFHALFNQFLLPPLLSTLLLLAVVPALIALVFSRSERATKEWLGAGFDTDQELLQLFASGELTRTRVGRYVLALQERFPGEVIADMLCLLQLRVELSIQAKGILMMQEAGFRVPPDPVVEEKIAELRYLERSVGTTGLLALAPVLQTGSRDLWHLQMLQQA